MFTHNTPTHARSHTDSSIISHNRIKSTLPPATVPYASQQCVLYLPVCMSFLPKSDHMAAPSRIELGINCPR